MATGSASLMKEFVRRQLRHWVEGFRDEQLPRDLGARGFGRPQLSLAKVHLKPDRVAALMHLPDTLVVTRAFCTELVIRVPSWTAADKFLQEPLALQLGDVFIDVRHKGEIDEEQRKQVERRVEAARFEPDPLGSIASMYAFATMISERLSLSVDNVYVKFFVQSARMQVHLELSSFRARTTNALWQDMRDLSNCVERSPDGLLRTRFKFISFTCSLQLLQNKEGQSPSDPIKILHDNAMSIRLTLFAQRNSTAETSEALSRVVDVNLGALRFEHSAADYVQLYSSFCVAWMWAFHTSAASEATHDRTNKQPHLHRGRPSDRHLSNNRLNELDGDTRPAHASFAWQVTIRLSIEAVVTFTSERLGRQSIVTSTQQAVFNVIIGQDGLRELQLTLDALVAQFRGSIVLQLTPAPGTLQIKQGASTQDNIVVRWKVQHLLCRLEGDLALIVNELYHSMNEKELSTTVTCGTCHQKIPLDKIDSHQCCNKTQVSHDSKSPHKSTHSTATESTHVRDEDPTIKSDLVASVALMQLRAVLYLDECELYADNHLFYNVQQLLRISGGNYSVDKTIVTKLSKIHLTTESTEFDGGAVFVPVLPLAFQMLECAIQNCGCWAQQNYNTSSRSPSDASNILTQSSLSTVADGCHWVLPFFGTKVRFPEMCFFDIEHGSITTLDSQADLHSSNAESFTLEGLKIRSSFSDGSNICYSCHPQVAIHASINRIRCRLEFQHLMRLRHEFSSVVDKFNSEQTLGITALLLFTCVIQIRAVELTLREALSEVSKTKNLLKQIATVMDNQLGYLVTQSTLDFRSLLNSTSLMRFVHSVTPKHPSRASLSLAELSRRRDETLDCAARMIQYFARRFCDKSHKTKPIMNVTHFNSSENHKIADHLSSRSHCFDEQNSSSPRSVSISSILQIQTQTHVTQDSFIPEESESGLKPNPEIDDSPNTKSTGIPISKQPANRTPSNSSVKSPTAAMLSAAEDLVNPMKMVAGAAGVFRDGFKFVKSTHQAIETEVVGLASQSLGTAARLVMLPKIGIAKMSASASGITSPKRTGDVKGADVPHQTPIVPPCKPCELSNSHKAGSNRNLPKSSSGNESEADGRSSSLLLGVKGYGATLPRDPSFDDEAKSLSTSDSNADQGIPNVSAYITRDTESDDCDEIGGLGQAQECTISQSANGDVVAKQIETDEEYLAVGISESSLSSLPEVVRILVQVADHRVCVPINPREKVGYLCREVVRRYNELFVALGEGDGESGAGFGSYQLSRVALHDRYGGVFCPTDLVWHLIHGVTDSSGDTVPVLFFARPIDPDTNAIVPRASVRLTTPDISTNCLLKGASTTASEERHVGKKFARCSRLPLPLTVALLANESESELLRLVLTEKSCFGSHGAVDSVALDTDGSWPDLALNAGHLGRYLTVEVAWFKSCIEVTHIDAFVLCLQQLGMCSSRPTSRFVGRALRDRLRICASENNPLLVAAWRRRIEASICTASELQHSHQTTPRQRDDRHTVSHGHENIDLLTYEAVKTLVQHHVGTYMRSDV